ncbi:hypothetical protein DICVIV_07951 [Dictyocaulus viviparus]|uniref:Phosphofurin acidic cluster sorting protein 1/2 C-terminal domain-containing protein n=1 Tax=Dictyocaulus viviparus TaxID=29172 RepID=A0A0D8XMX6_DICVI|nr:hypothetical protein DICVIV_07951 [Dictyocaulus viviparus]
MVNLTQLLQQGGLREIPLWLPENTDKQSSVQNIGRLYLVTCQTQPLEIDFDRDRIAKKHSGIEADLSEDDSDSDYEDAPIDSDINESTSTHHAARRRTVQLNKASRVNRKNNLRQRFVTLLRKFKIPEEEDLPSHTASAALVPTDKELEDLFEELENMSDSGPELAIDEISISSNPRPGLRPYFTRSKELLPSIYDRVFQKDAENVSDIEDEAEEVEWSTDTEKEREKEENPTFSSNNEPFKDTSLSTLASADHGNIVVSNPQMRMGSTPLVPSTSFSGMSHLLTSNSILKKNDQFSTVTEKNSISEKLSALLSTYPVVSTGCWLCSLNDLPHLSMISVPLVDCPTFSLVKIAMSQIRCCSSCNSNSSNPPITFIGAIGGDKFIGHILRAYVECLHHKSSSNWLHYLRFALIPAPHSLISKLLEGLDLALDQLCKDIWERWAELSAPDKSSVVEKMTAWLTAGGGACLNLPIGEALLQMTEKGQEIEACRVFVPFLAEVRVGQSWEDDDLSSSIYSPRNVEVEKESVLSGRDREYSTGVSNSPPNSPHIRSDAREMHIEYWLGRDSSNENVNILNSQSTTPNSRKDVSKSSVKASFRTLVITRSCNQPLLSLHFVKEKKKEKMLQKLGMKKGQELVDSSTFTFQKTENDNPHVQVIAVSRLICSGASKHSDLTVSVDGLTYERVRYFQCSSQWQTHVKSFPVSLITQGVSSLIL